MKIKDGQRFALNKLIQHWALNRKMRLHIISELLNKQIESTSDLTIWDWQTIRNMAYDNWADDDWNYSEEFDAKIKKIADVYEREVMGQGSLF